MNNRLDTIMSFLDERKNEGGVKQLCSARDIELTDFGRFTKHCYELADYISAANVPRQRPLHAETDSENHNQTSGG